MPGPEYANYALTPNRHPIVFQPGMHTLSQVPSFDWGSSRIEAQFRAGDLNAHHWNPEVAERINNDRNLRTYVIGLDSIGGSGDGNPSWPWLPGSPSQINGGERYFVVGGDFLGWQLNGCEDKPAMKAELEQLDWDFINSYGGQISAEASLTAGLGLGGAVAALRSPAKTGRRGFLASMGVLGLGLTFGRLAPVIQSYTDNPTLAQAAQMLTDQTRFRMAKSTWLDARTALLTAKTIDAMDTMPDLEAGAGGSIVFGWPHGYEAGRILHDRLYRADLFQKFLTQLHTPIYEVEVKYGVSSDNEMSRRDSLDNLARLLASYRVWEIHQPEADFVDDSKAAAAQLIIPVSRQYCPEVVEALKPISDPVRFGLF